MKKVENKFQMKEYVEQEMKRLENRRLQMKNMISNPNYILWLQEFTKKYPKFRIDDFLDNKDNISSKDLNNIQNLDLFYEGIREYSENNYIYPFLEDDFVRFYRIQYNDIGYEIGTFDDSKKYFFCEKTNNVNEDYIQYNDIMLNNQQKNTEYIKKRLLELSNIITYFYEQNIPLSAIRDTINDTLWQIEDQNEKKYKLLRKSL